MHPALGFRFPLWLLTLLIPGAILAAPFSGSIHAADQQHDLASIREAWKRREARITSAKFEWTLTDTITRGYLTRAFGEEDYPGTMPPTDVTQEEHATLILDRTRMRYETRGNRWSKDHNALVARPYVSVFDGEKSIVYWPPSVREGIASIKPDRFNHDVNNYYLMPVLSATRPSLVLAEFLTGSISPVIKEAFVENRPCVVLQNERDSQKTRSSVWVDPSRDYSIVRFILSWNDITLIQIDIAHEPDPQYGWLSSSWRTLAKWQEPLPQRLTKGVVKKREINLPLQEDDFRVQFAVGTIVTDTSARDEINYLLREGGAKRMITPADYGATYEQVVATESGQALKPPEAPWKLWIALLILALLMITGSVLAWRRLRLTRNARA